MALAEGDQKPGQGKRPGAGGGQFFERLDQDGDGKISQSEAPAQAWERLSKMDSNSDGSVTKEEIMAGMKAAGGPGAGAPGGGGNMAAMMMERMDTDGDGKISQAEAGERWERLSKMDKNSDGSISKDELPAGRPGAGSGPGAGPGTGNRGEFFAKADTNGDGKLTQEEAPQAWERLSKADTNSDGAVSKEELAAVMQKAGEGRGPKGSESKPEGGQKPKRPPVES